jgi:chromosome segregation ATPase
LEKYRSLAQENESLKSRFSQLEYTYTSRSELELTRIKSEYEQRLETLSRSQGTELQSRIQAYEGELERLRGEVERLRGALKARSEEFEQQRGRAYELEVAMKRAEVDTSARIKNYEVAIGNFKRENEDYYNRLKAAGESERRAIELQAKLTQYEREIERVTLNVKAREEEIIGLRSKLRDTEGVVQRYEFDVGKSKSGFEQSISTLRADNDALNRRLAELVNESNEKLKLAGQEIDRLGGLLRTKSE